MAFFRLQMIFSRIFSLFQNFIFQNAQPYIEIYQLWKQAKNFYIISRHVAPITSRLYKIGIAFVYISIQND